MFLNDVLLNVFLKSTYCAHDEKIVGWVGGGPTRKRFIVKPTEIVFNVYIYFKPTMNTGAIAE